MGAEDRGVPPDRPTLSELPFYPLLPSFLSMPDEGREIFESMADATIVRIGTTAPGLIEGGGLIIDYRRPGSLVVERLVLGFSELGMWVEGHLPLSRSV